MRFLVVEDNKNLAHAMKRGLEEHGHVVDLAHTGEEGEELAAAESYDLVILDVMLPDRDGMVVTRNLRRRRVSTYIILLTALSATAERIRGLEAGADDYMTKPFDFDELLARARAILRRGKPSEAIRLVYEDLEVDLLRREARREGHRIVLHTKELALLELLVRNADRVVGRTTIARTLWDMDDEPSSNVIEKYVSSLRQKIDRGFGFPLIHTVIGTGYRLGRSEPSEA